MKLPLVFTLALAAFPALAGNLSEIKTVYLLPMSRGLDQFLAERLTGQGLLQVVTDPSKADALVTDRIGANFDESLNQLYGDAQKPVSGKAEDTPYKRPAMQPLSRGKGNVFLVERSTKNVIWSTFVLPKTNDSNDLSRTAGTIADRLGKALKKK